MAGLSGRLLLLLVHLVGGLRTVVGGVGLLTPMGAPGEGSDVVARQGVLSPMHRYTGSARALLSMLLFAGRLLFVHIAVHSVFRVNVAVGGRGLDVAGRSLSKVVCHRGRSLNAEGTMGHRDGRGRQAGCWWLFGGVSRLLLLLLLLGLLLVLLWLVRTSFRIRSIDGCSGRDRIGGRCRSCWAAWLNGRCLLGGLLLLACLLLLLAVALGVCLRRWWYQLRRTSSDGRRRRRRRG